MRCADPHAPSRVGIRMRRLGHLAFVLATLGVAACHHDKGGKTTPGGGSGSAGGSDATGMTGGSTTDGSANGGSDQGSGAGTNDGSGTGSDTTPPPPDPAEIGDTSHLEENGSPHVVPPNLDPDPQEASADVEKHLKKARASLASNTPDDAIAEAKLALAVDGTSVDAVVVLAHAYYEKKLYDTAETILDMAYKDKTRSDVVQSNPGVYYVYGLIYDKEGKPDAAFKAFQKAVELKSDYGSALVNLGSHQLANKQYSAAVGTYEQLTGSLGYSDAITWNALGASYRGRSADFDPGSGPRADWLLKAQTAFQHAVQSDDNYGMAYYNLGILYLDADPFPTSDGGSLDNLVRLKKAQTYFDEYKTRPGVDLALYDERTKNVTKLIKREEKKRKKSGGDQ